MAAFEPEQVRGVTEQQRLARAISVALKDATERGVTREQIAERMSDFLGVGQKVSTNMLNAYASAAREDHIIGVVRFAALLHATGDRRLLEMIAAPMGWAVIERKQLAMIELAAVQEAEDAMRRRREALRRQAKAEGAL